MSALPASLAIVAGGGAFPKMIANHLKGRGVSIFIVHLQGDSDEFKGFNDMVARPEQLGLIFKNLRQHNIHDLVLIGRMKRPGLFDLRPDWDTIKIMGRVAFNLLFGGDDALLKSVRKMLEREGFQVHAAQEFIDGLGAPTGVFSKTAPHDDVRNQIQVGMDAARNLGSRDIGQAIVMRDGMISGREDQRGTDFLIKANAGRNGVLVKMAKPQQDKALDMPCIGPDTVKRCAEAGFAGIAVEAGSVLIAERDDVVALADAANMFLIGVK